VASHLSFSPDSKLLAFISAGGVVSVWDVKTGVTVLDKENGVAIWEGVNSVTFSTDSTLLIVVSFAQIQVWRVVTGDCVYHLCHPQSNVTSMSLLTPGLIASGSGMGDIRIWELETGRLVSKLEGHRRPVRALAVSADKKLLASGSDDGTMMISQRDNWIRVKTLGAPEGGAISRMAFSSDSNLIAVAASSLSDDKPTTRPAASLPLLTLTTSLSLPESMPPKERELSASPDSEAVPATPSDTVIMDDVECPGDDTEGEIVIFPIESCQPLQVLCKYQRSPDLMFRSGSVLVISDPESVAMSTWQADTGQLLHELLNDGSRCFTATAPSPDSIVKISAGFRTTETWYTESGACRQRRNVRNGSVFGSTAVAISADLKLIASATDHGEVKVCQVSLVEDDCSQPQTSRIEKMASAISPDLSLYASFDFETATWTIRETITGRCRHEFNSKHPHERLVFSPDSKSALVMDGRVLV
jgi:WD40 repeat protein